MILTIELTLGLITVLGLVVLWSKYRLSYWKRNNIAYVEPIPFLGNTKTLLSQSQNFGQLLNSIYKDPKFEKCPIVGLYNFHMPGLVVRDLDIIKNILIKDFHKFSNRNASADPHHDALAHYNLFFVRNPVWKEIRTKLTPVFTSGKIKQMYPLMTEIGRELEVHLESFKKDNRNSFVTEVKEFCANFTTDLIASTAFGIRVNSLKNPNADFRQYGRKIFDYSLERAFTFFVTFNAPQWISFFRAKIIPGAFQDYIRKSFIQIIEEREKSGYRRNDLIDILVALKKETAISDKGSIFVKNLDVLIAQANVFLTAGFETSSSTMSFAIYELTKNPATQDRLRSEIIETLKAENGEMSYETINNLPYLNMVVDETLRKYPVLPFLDRKHETPKGETAFSLQPHHDYVLPEGLPVFIPIFAIHRDPNYWPNPDKFDPERFSKENKQNIPSCAYMPFGNGPHNCIGSRIGLLQAKLGLVHFYKNHYAAFCDKNIEKDIEPKAFLLQFQGNLNMRIVNDGLWDKAQKQ